MNCVEVNDLLDQLMDGELSDGQRRALEAHGQTCAQCAGAIRATLQMKALFEQMEPEVDVPLQAQARWRGAVREAARAQRRKRLIRWAATAAAAVVALVGVGLALNLRSAPREDSTAMLTAVEESAPQAMAAGIRGNAMTMLPGATGAAEVYEAKAYDAADTAVVEADGVYEAAEDFAPEEAEEALFELNAADGEAVCAAVAQRAPSCEFTLTVEDVGAACERIRDLVEEYEGDADVQTLEDGGANVYVEIATEDAGDFLSAVMPMDASGEAWELPELTDKGTVLVLLTVNS